MNAAPDIECPACGLAVPFGTGICPQDGTPLLFEETGRGSAGQRPTLPGPVSAPGARPSGAKRGPGAGGDGSSSVEVDAKALQGSVKTVLRDPLIGAMLGEYRVEERIGLGGMGLVYRGVHPMINKPVAIKVLRPEICDSASHVERLLAEARAVNAIRHRGIIDIFSFGKTPDGRQYLVMEFLDGVALDTHIANRGLLAPNEAVTILEEMCAALAAAHGAGVIHRDLKPNNIFLVKQGYGQPYVKILDFGLAKQGLPPGGTTPQTHFGLVVGTPEYMAPEQARGENVGPKTDLYALGVVAFQMLTGRLPFDGNSPMDYVVKHLEHQPPTVIEEQPDVPQDLSDLVGRLLAKRPEDRPGSAEEVRRMVRRIARAMPQEITNAGVPMPKPPAIRPLTPPEAQPAPPPPPVVAPAPPPTPAPRTPPRASGAKKVIVRPSAELASLPTPPPRDLRNEEPTQPRQASEPRRSSPSRTAVTVVTLTPRARMTITVGVLAVVMAIVGVGVGLLLRQRGAGPGGVAPPVAVEPATVKPPDPPPDAKPPEVKPPDPPPEVKPPEAPVTPVVVQKPDEPGPKPPPKPKETKPKPQVSLDKVLTRIESLTQRYAESPAPSRLAAVALSTKRNDALRANPDELREIWGWLDRWENQYLPQR